MKTLRVNNDSFSCNQKRGTYYEQYVCDLIPNAININKPFDKRLCYDLLWNGVAIDVKSTIVIKDSGKCTFSFSHRNEHMGVVLVHIAIDTEMTYFWVQPYALTCKYTFNISDSLSPEELPEAIYKASKIANNSISYYTTLKYY